MTSWKMIGPLILIGAASMGTFGGCSKENPSSNYPTPGASQGDEPAPGSKDELNDRQILGVLSAVDAGEINQGRVALSRASDPSVKQFAAHMIDQHTESTQKASTLASQYDLMPAASSVATTLQDKASKVKSALDQASDSAFDGTYMKAQIQQHQEVLDMLKSQLMPQARNEALTVQLRAAETMVQNHLNEAREIQPRLQAAEPAPSQAMHE